MVFKDIFLEETNLSLDNFQYLKEKIDPLMDISHFFSIKTEKLNLLTLFITYLDEGYQVYMEIKIKRVNWNPESDYLIDVKEIHRKVYLFSFLEYQSRIKKLKNKKLFESLFDVPVLEKGLIHRNFFIDVIILKLIPDRKHLWPSAYVKDINEMLVYDDKNIEGVFKAELTDVVDTILLYNRTEVMDILKRRVSNKDLEILKEEYRKQINDPNHEPKYNFLKDHKTLFLRNIPKRFIERLKEEIIMEIL